MFLRLVLVLVLVDKVDGFFDVAEDEVAVRVVGLCIVCQR